MSIKRKELIVRERKTCSVCGGRRLSEIVRLPGLPLTGIFSDKIVSGSFKGIDQSLLWCPQCSHAQLSKQIDPSVLYDSKNYSFKTSASATAKDGTKVFMKFLKGVSRNRIFNTILDVGCNDLHLLKEMKTIGRIRVGIDPIWRTENPDNKDPSMLVVGGTVEDIDLGKALPQRPDLIVCRHTLEHIYEPLLVLEKLGEFAAEDALFIFEFPLFESLIRKMRFDQIFHEHLQYFSIKSFTAILNRCGFELMGYTENYHNWGALIAAFRKRKKSNRQSSFPFSEKEIKNKFKLFKNHLRSIKRSLIELGDAPIYGYGAALMLPVLAYHLESDLSFLECIMDDDEIKEGLYYINLPVKIQKPDTVKELKNATVFITAADNVKPIMERLMRSRPRNIVYPFSVM